MDFVALIASTDKFLFHLITYLQQYSFDLQTMIISESLYPVNFTVPWEDCLRRPAASSNLHASLAHSSTASFFFPVTAASA